MSEEERKLLAWHETLEIHELVAFQSVGLIKLKMAVNKVNDKELKDLYRKVINELKQNVTELISFYSSVPAPVQREEESEREDHSFYAADLLTLLKTSVRNYSVAITETATPVLRKTLINHLVRAINGHEQIFRYMLKNGYYPAYDLGQMLENDLKNAHKALRM
ncbi:spore coat protein [Neobacillus sp. SM06]|uniref:spore coat protein n=1 Tax=Neobacillus sp. SM06 TaxID=3422492 RepID=UPI003D2D4C44